MVVLSHNYEKIRNQMRDLQRNRNSGQKVPLLSMSKRSVSISSGLQSQAQKFGVNDCFFVLFCFANGSSRPFYDVAFRAALFNDIYITNIDTYYTSFYQSEDDMYVYLV